MQIFEVVRTLLTAQRLLLRAGTIVDATIIAVPSSTKNATTTRDLAMKQTRQGLDHASDQHGSHVKRDAEAQSQARQAAGTAPS